MNNFFEFFSTNVTVEQTASTLFILATICVGVWKFASKWRLKTKKFERFNILHTAVSELLTELRVEVHAHHALIIQFHNSGYFANSVSMLKMSCIHESCERGLVSQVPTMTNLLCSMASSTLKYIPRDVGSIIDVSSLENDFIKSFFESNNILLIGIFPIQHKNEYIGFVLLEWGSLDHNHDAHKTTCESLINSIKIQLALQS